MKIDMIAFDADDTLWENEPLYQNAQTRFKQLLSPWGAPSVIEKVLYETEISNLPIYGYGIKAFSLSMLETALKVSAGKISGDEVSAILAITRAMLEAEVELRPHVEEVLAALSRSFPLMVITKGDLLDQTSKINRSGLAKYFSIIEVINEKTPETYAAVLEKHGLAPGNFLMVGNSLRSDILPVLELGGKAVFIPASKTWAHEDMPGFDLQREDYLQLEHFGQLPALIAAGV